LFTTVDIPGVELYVMRIRTAPKGLGEFGASSVVPVAIEMIFTTASHWTRRLPIPANDFAADRSGESLLTPRTLAAAWCLKGW
jgi:CO/xanthine dehydrogenase Mo-binding subunit